MRQVQDSLLKFVGAIKIGFESEEDSLTVIYIYIKKVLRQSSYEKIKAFIYFCANQEETGKIGFSSAGRRKTSEVSIKCYSKVSCNVCVCEKELLFVFI